jgi:hypothetical protein
MVKRSRAEERLCERNTWPFNAIDKRAGFG